ncbi:MAG TPA: nitroreductase family protein [Acidimicrobiales bacterium]|nr:nitroreductase family protein [Acidimicrobiales bacterium]
MELTEALARRRMVRSFSGRPVDAQVVEGIVARALAAPSAGNTRGWDAVLLVGEEETAPFWSATTTADWRVRSRRWPGLARAPVVVALFAHPGAYVARYAEPDKAGAPGGDPRGRLGEDAAAWPVPYWFVDAAFGAMALLLGAAGAGLGACFLGNFRGEEGLREALGVPHDRRYVGAVLLGEPGGDDPRSASLEGPRRARSSMVHRGRW